MPCKQSTYRKRGTTIYGIWAWFLTREFLSIREMQLFLIGYIVIEICEIFTVGGFPLDTDVRKVGLNME